MKDGGNAFPMILGANTGTDSVTFKQSQGMSLLDWFAGMAISGSPDGDARETAEWAYRLARAMIKERENGLQ